ncbi:MAG: glycoside hydrolase family 3 C-terminal domain-containing protein [Propionibacteriaceae bacterium]|jgi:beta-glucosidase|nr:glycoside hydrolase family 3 C-terminal domain-containing protein [Propionibacteriaceae bacterium]
MRSTTYRRSIIAGLLTAGLVFTGMPGITTQQAAAAPLLPYQDQTLPFSVRAADLVSRMTLEEKAPQFASTLYTGSSGAAAPAIPRLGVRTYNYWSEALHGVAREGLATEFPTGLNIAGTWDRDLVQAATNAISDEARVKTNDCYTLDAQGQPTVSVDTQCKGLTYWSPTINLARDPRWGRADENYGEDPYLAGETAGQFVLGLQGGNASKPDTVGGGIQANYLKAVSTTKHYLANNSEVNRHDGTSNLSDRSLHEYYTAHFGKAMQEYGVKSYMTSYNAVNVVDTFTTDTAAPLIKTGVESDFTSMGSGTYEASTPVSASIYVNNTLLRRMYGFDGFSTSDCGATNNVIGVGASFSGGHAWRPEALGGRQVTAAEGAAWSLKAGTDVDCWATVYPQTLPVAQQQGLATEQDWDVALVRAFTVRFQTGEFDTVNPYRTSQYVSAANNDKSIESAEHQAIAHQMSLESPVLLKNDGNVLPFTSKSGNTVIVGYYGEEPVHGGYSPESTLNTKSAYEGVRDFVGASGNVSIIDDADLGFFSSSKPIIGGSMDMMTFQYRAIDYYDATNTYIGFAPANASTITADGAGYTYGCFSWGSVSFCFGGNGASLNGYFDIKQTAGVPAGANSIQIPLSLPYGGTSYLPAAAGEPAGCMSTPVGCKTIGEITLQAGSHTPVTVPVYKNEYITGASSYATQYLPLNVTLAQLGLAPGDTDTIRFSFGLTGVAAGGSGLSFTTAQENQIKAADRVIVYIGTAEGDSNEEQDRPNVNFPQSQAQMAKQIAQWNPNTVVWIQAVGQMNITPFKDDVKAIIWSTYNGQFQGDAVAEVLWNASVNVGAGKTVQANPSGRLTYTYYSDVPNQLTASTDYALTTTEYKATTDPDGTICGRTYWYYKVSASCAAPDYVFGHGLSYTSFAYSGLTLSQTSVTPNDTINASVTVTNTGAYAGREVVELYAISPGADGENRPLKQLKGYAKTDLLQPGASVTVSIPLKASDLWFWDTAGQKRVYDTGAWKIQVAPSSADGAGLTATLNISGTRKAGVDVVTAIPDGVQLYLTTPDNVINANLSATKHDQSFWDLTDPAVKVEYSVQNPVVAKVTADGVVSPIAEGATLVVAKVTADGETKQTTFPVVVHSRNITSGVAMTQGNAADGYPLPSVTDYTFQVNFPTPSPTLSEAKAGVQLKANIFPDVTGTETFSYLIAPMDNNSAGASVTNSGLLKATKTGEVEVTVVAELNGVQKSHTIRVRVTADPVAPQEPTTPSSKVNLATSTVKAGWRAYTGKQVKPGSIVVNGVKLVEGTDFTYTSLGTNKAIGKGTAVISGIGTHEGTKSVTFKIVPAKSKITALTPAKKSLKVTWKKSSSAEGVTGYQVAYKVKGAASFKTKTVTGASKTSLTLTGLTKGKQYTIKVRAYKKISGVSYPGPWTQKTSTKKVK